jgi:hypothetical protein
LPCLALPCLALPCLALPCLALPCLAKNNLELITLYMQFTEYKISVVLNDNKHFTSYK